MLEIWPGIICEHGIKKFPIEINMSTEMVYDHAKNAHVKCEYKVEMMRTVHWMWIHTSDENSVMALNVNKYCNSVMGLIVNEYDGNSVMALVSDNSVMALQEWKVQCDGTNIWKCDGTYMRDHNAKCLLWICVRITVGWHWC